MSSVNIGANVIMWNLQELDHSNPDKAETRALKKRVHNFMKIIESLLLSANNLVLSVVSSLPYLVL